MSGRDIASVGTKFCNSSIVYKLYPQNKADRIPQVVIINSAMHQNAFKRAGVSKFGYFNG